MSDKEWEAENIFDLFGDTLARHILVLTSRIPMAADELADYLDVSHPTIYRRINTLQNYDLLEKEFQITADGHNDKTFETTLR